MTIFIDNKKSRLKFRKKNLMSRLDFFEKQVISFKEKPTIGVFSSSQEEKNLVIQQGNSLGIEFVEKDPLILISYGGYGTFLRACCKYPDSIIVPVRRSEEHLFCEKHGLLNILNNIKNIDSNYFNDIICLDTLHSNTHKLFAVNDISLKSLDQKSALRFTVHFGIRNEFFYSQNVIGDGIVLCTSFGSSGYYRAITKSIIRQGYGFAYNNSTESVDHQVLPNQFVVKIFCDRGDSLLISDNQPTIVIPQGESVVIQNGFRKIKTMFLDSLT